MHEPGELIHFSSVTPIFLSSSSFPVSTNDFILFFFKKNFIIVNLQYSVNFYCTLKWPIYIYIHSFSHIILHHVPSQVTRCSSLCYAAGSHCLSTPNAIVCIFILFLSSLKAYLKLVSGSKYRILFTYSKGLFSFI